MLFFKFYIVKLIVSHFIPLCVVTGVWFHMCRCLYYQIKNILLNQKHRAETLIVHLCIIQLYNGRSKWLGRSGLCFRLSLYCRTGNFYGLKYSWMHDCNVFADYILAQVKYREILHLSMVCVGMWFVFCGRKNVR